MNDEDALFKVVSYCGNLLAKIVINPVSLIIVTIIWFNTIFSLPGPFETFLIVKGKMG